MRHFATIIIPVRGSSCGNQYIPHAMSDRYYWSLWKVIARMSSEGGEIHLSDPVAVHWSLSQREAMAKCVASASRGSLVCSENIMNYSGYTPAQFLREACDSRNSAPFSSHEWDVSEYYTLDEVARKFRVSERTIYSWVKSGKLSPSRVGQGKYLFAKSVIEAMLRA